MDSPLLARRDDLTRSPFGLESHFHRHQNIEKQFHVHVAILLQQFLQRRKRRIVRVGTVTAVPHVQILPAFGTQPFAIRVVQGVDRHFEQRVFTQNGRKVNLHIVGEHQPSLARCIFAKGV